LEVVLADGSIVSSIDTLPKVSTGPDLLQTLIGSEGTLGVITAARMKLWSPVEANPFVVLVGVDRLADGLRLISPATHAIEFFDRACLEAVIDHEGLSRPFPSDFPFYVLLESAEPPDVDSDAEAVVDRSLWRYRESITETISQIGVPVKLDVALPLDRMDEFAEGIVAIREVGTTFLYGHLAEGNFHVNVVGSSDPEALVDEVLSMVVALGGAIASEHGVGVAKTDWWRQTTDPAAIELARGIKHALDPKGILNPGVFWGD
jgi:FAD/FMN-containing dehydrogenase